MFAQRHSTHPHTSWPRCRAWHPSTRALALLSLALAGHVGGQSQLIAQTSDSVQAKSLSARELYGQAARALVAKDVAQAAVALSQLIETYPQDEMAPLAAMRLAQCQMSAGQTSQAIAVLEKWLPELAKSTKSRTLDPSAELDAQALLARAYLLNAQYDKAIELAKQADALAANPKTLSDAQQRAVQQIQSISSAAASRREAGQATALREAARLVREKRFEPAQAELKKVDTALLGPDWLWRYHVLCAQCQLGVGQATAATEQLNRIELAKLQPKEQAVVRVLRMEAALGTGRLSDAEKELAALDVVAPTDSQQAATLDLRRAELALLRKDRRSVDQLARSARQKYPNFESLHEFDLMLARNCLACVEFEEARQILTRIIEQPPVRDPSAVPRARWLLGESYLLSQDYQKAIEYYSQVIEGNQALHWTESALLQRGRCYESLGQTAAALADYRRLADQFPKSSLRGDAQTRLSQLSGGAAEATLK